MQNIEELGIDQEDKAFVKDLLKKLIDNSDTEAVFFVGSLVKGVYKKKSSGIDIVVLINDSSTEYEVIDSLSNKGLSFYKSDDIYFVENTMTSIYIQRYEEYICYLKSIIVSEAKDAVIKDWAIGGVCREVILDDISHAFIVYDKKKKMIELSDELRGEYCFGSRYGKSLLSQLKMKINMTVRQYNEKNLIMFNIGFWETIELAERLFCHEKKIYNLGFKHVSKQEEFIEKFSLSEIGDTGIEYCKMKDILDRVAVVFEIGEQ